MKQLYHLGEDGVETGIQPLAPVVVYGTEVGLSHARKPHEADVAPEKFLYPTGGIDIAQIGKYQYLEHHLRVERTVAPATVSGKYTAYIKPLYYGIHYTHKVVCRDKFVQRRRKKKRLLFSVGFYC